MSLTARSRTLGLVALLTGLILVSAATAPASAAGHGSMLPLVPTATAPVQSTAPHAPLSPVNACAGAGTTANVVVRFYLALDRREFAAARGCLAAAQQQQMPVAAFVAGYAQTVATHLVLVQDSGTLSLVLNQVVIQLTSVDRNAATLQQNSFAGTWNVAPDGHLSTASIQRTGHHAALALPPLAIASLLDHAGYQVMWHQRRDVTGDGVADDIYVTSGKMCGSCHGQEVFIYERGRLIFMEDNADVDAVWHVPGGMMIKTGLAQYGYHTEVWRWTRYGFVLDEPCAVLRTTAVWNNSLSLGADAYLPGSRRQEIDAMHSRSDLARDGIFTGMPKAYGQGGYVGGCHERWALPGSPATTMEVQTDIFTNRGGGKVAYDAYSGMSPWVPSYFRLPLAALDRWTSAEGVTFIDMDPKDGSKQGAWLLAHLREGEVVITVMLHTDASDPNATRRLQGDFAYSQSALFAHLGALSLDCFFLAGSC